MKLDKSGLTRFIGNKILLTKKNSPHIFFVAGVVGLAGSAFLACRATLKLEENLDKLKEDLDGVKEIYHNDRSSATAHPEVNSSPEAEAYKNVGYVAVRTVVIFGKLYGPAIVLGGVSVAALTGSHIQLTRRNAALSATLAAATRAYDEYRTRVQKEIGREREFEVYHDIKDTTKMVDGKKTLEKVRGVHGSSTYAQFYDSANVNWYNDPDMNRSFLTCQETHANHLLHARGHVFLNDVYDSLGFDRTSAGAVVGWVRNGEGDGHIDFGLDEPFNKAFRNMLLDFNVDGVIYELI